MEAMPFEDGSDGDLPVWRLDLHHPRRGNSQSDRCEALGLQIGQGPRYARTGFPHGRHVGFDCMTEPGVRIPQTGDL